MKIKIYNIVTIVMLLWSVHTVQAQVPASLYFMDNIPQSSMLNPASQPNYKFYLGIPVFSRVSLDVNSDFDLNDFYSDGNYVWNSANAFEDFVGALPETSFMSLEFNTAVINMGFALNEESYLHFGVNQRIDMTLGIPKGLFQMNDLTINHDFSGFEMQGRSYYECYVGYSRQISDKLNVGVRAKYLSGVAAAEIQFDQLELETTEEEWALRVDGEMNLSAPIKITPEGNGYNSESTIDLDNNNDLINFGLPNFNNPGFAIDLGAEYQILSKLKLSASITDLGGINWKTDATNLSTEFEYSFTGIEDLITTDTEDGIIGINTDAVDAISDSLENLVSMTQGNEAFYTSLSPKLFIGAEYELTPSLSVGVLSKTRFIRKEIRENVIFSANANLRHFLTLGATYNVGINSYNSYGGVVGVKLAPLYIYVSADMVPGYQIKDGLKEFDSSKILIPGGVSGASIQAGINIVFGERRRAKARKARKYPSPLLENSSESSMSYPL